MAQRYFEDVEIGDEFEEEEVPSTDDVNRFLTMRPGQGGGGDGRFTDDERAKKLGLPGAIVPGAMSLSILSRIVTDWAGMEGRLRSLDVSFRRSVLHNDRLKLLTLVTDTSEEPEGPRVKLDVYMENERGERPVQGTAVVELPRRPA